MVCHVHDLTIPLHHQTMCARVLTQLIPLLLNKHAAGSPEDKSFVESLFQLQLETFLRKIEGLSEIRSEWDKWQRRRPAGSSQKPEDEVDVERRKVVDTVYCMSDNPNDPPFHSLRGS